MGFDTDKVVYLRLSREDDRIIFYYYFEGEEINEFNTIELKNCNSIKMNKKGYSIECDIFKNSEKDEDLFSKTKFVYRGKEYSEKDEDFIFDADIRVFPRVFNINFKYSELDKEVSFHISGGEISCDFSNEKVLKLQEYLGGLQLPISLLDTYKELCEIFLIDNDYVYKGYLIVTDKKTNNDISLDYFSSFHNSKYTIQEGDRTIKYRRRNGVSSVNIDIHDDDYKFSILVDGVNKIENELELQKYLMGLIFPISIDKVYKKICEISLGDVGKYSRVVLSVFKNDINTDLIDLSNGNLERFGMTKNNKTVFLDNKDNFLYKMIDENVNLTVEMDKNGKTKIEVSTDSHQDMSEYMDSLALYDVNCVTTEKEKTRKLVRKMFQNNDDDSD